MPSILKGNNSIISGNTTFTVRPMFANNTPWDSGNLTPANYAALSGAAFTNTVSMPSLTVNGTITSGGGVQVGNGVSTGVYGDGSAMLALKGYGNSTVYIQSQAGSSYAAFNPTLNTFYANTVINGTLTLYGGLLQTDLPGYGGLRLLNGGANTTGYIEFRTGNTAAPRMGYIGAGSGNNIIMAGETGAYTFNGLTPIFNNGLNVAAGNTSMVNSTVSGTLTVSSSLILPSGAGSSLFGGGTGDGASYTVYNTKLQIWNGLGLASFDGTINAYYDSRNGVWDTKGVPKVNGQQVWYPGNFTPASKLNAYQPSVTGDLGINSIANGSFGALIFYNTNAVADYVILPSSQVPGRSLVLQANGVTAFAIDKNAITNFSSNTVFNSVSTIFNGQVDSRNFMSANGTVGSISNSAGNQAKLEVKSASATDAAFIQFHKPGDWAFYFGMDTDRQLKVGGWSMGNTAYTIWHSGNFTPANYASLTNPTFPSNVYVNGSVIIQGGQSFQTDYNGNGGLRLINGGNNQTGYIEFRTSNTAAPRLGYIGFGPLAGGAINLSGEGISYFNFTGNAPVFNGGLISYGQFNVNDSNAIQFGSTTASKINLFGTSYAIGIQNNTAYLRTAANFSVYLGGAHDNTEGNAGTGGTELLKISNGSILYKGNPIYYTRAMGGGLGYESNINANNLVTVADHRFIDGASGINLPANTSSYYYFGFGGGDNPGRGAQMMMRGSDSALFYRANVGANNNTWNGWKQAATLDSANFGALNVNGNPAWHNGLIAWNASATGYYKFPNGLIIQWGYDNTGSSDVYIAFPTGFPNAVFSVNSNMGVDNSAGNVAYTTTCYVINNYGFNHRKRAIISGGTVQQDGNVCRWIAIGY